MTIGDALLAAEERPSSFWQPRSARLLHNLMCVVLAAHDEICDCNNDEHVAECAWVRFIRRELPSVPLFAGGWINESMRSASTRAWIRHRPKPVPHGLLVFQFPDGEVVKDG